MEILALFLQRKVIITLAIIGAIIAMTGNYLGLKGHIDPKLAKFLRTLGYSVSWSSVVLFIAAWFFQ